MVLEKGIAKGKIGFREKGAQFKNFQALSQVYEAAINRVRPLIPYSLASSGCSGTQTERCLSQSCFLKIPVINLGTFLMQSRFCPPKSQ